MTKPRFPKPFMILAVTAVSALTISLSSTVAAQPLPVPPIEDENQEEFEEPDLDEPDLDEPDLDEPDLDEPDLDEPDLDEPDLDEPDLDEPDLDEPDLDEPDLDEPDLDEPDLDEPDLDEPDLDEPDLDEPYTARITVVRGDTLWGLARTHLGSGFRWPEIFALNEGIVQADGRALTNPDLILIGWVLEIPQLSA